MPRNTFTEMFDNAGENRTATHLSTNIVIVAEGNVVGAVQSLQVTESRGTIRMVDEIGTDGHIDSAPQKSTDYSGSCQRVRFDKMRIAESFSRGFAHVKSQRLPFDIEIHDYFQDADKGNGIITTIKNVWIREITYTYSATDFVIAETMNWDAEDIFSIIKSGSNIVPAGAANGRQYPVVVNSVERETDISSSYRGALDAAGLLNAFSE